MFLHKAMLNLSIELIFCTYYLLFIFLNYFSQLFPKARDSISTNTSTQQYVESLIIQTRLHGHNKFWDEPMNNDVSQSHSSTGKPKRHVVVSRSCVTSIIIDLFDDKMIF